MIVQESKLQLGRLLISRKYNPFVSKGFPQYFYNKNKLYKARATLSLGKVLGQRSTPGGRTSLWQTLIRCPVKGEYRNDVVSVLLWIFG